MRKNAKFWQKKCTIFHWKPYRSRFKNLNMFPFYYSKVLKEFVEAKFLMDSMDLNIKGSF